MHDNADNVNPAQDSLPDQIVRVLTLATNHGEYDAADFISRAYFGDDKMAEYDKLIAEAHDGQWPRKKLVDEVLRRERERVRDQCHAWDGERCHNGWCACEQRANPRRGGLLR